MHNLQDSKSSLCRRSSRDKRENSLDSIFDHKFTRRYTEAWQNGCLQSSGYSLTKRTCANKLFRVDVGNPDLGKDSKPGEGFLRFMQQTKKSKIPVLELYKRTKNSNILKNGSNLIFENSRLRSMFLTERHKETVDHSMERSQNEAYCATDANCRPKEQSSRNLTFMRD